jgi:50S ribosome-binding GTPase/Domain of unknown function (DUF3482)
MSTGDLLPSDVDAAAAPRRITFSLISHTNVGKTTLARTLLRRDVGEVRDQAHTTDLAEAYLLIAADGCELRLWDTPGFGDSVRLLARLSRHQQPVVWFLQQLWDRFADRPLWCSQQAALNVRSEADLVLYLVNATEEPEDAGYVAPELDLLAWIERPILVILNQTGGAEIPAEPMRQRLEAWRRHLRPWPTVRDVVALDAFSRCWVQESLLFERAVDLLPEAARGCMQSLRRAWDRRNLEVFERSAAAAARYLAAAAVDREPLPERQGGLRKKVAGGGDKRRAMAALGQRLQASTEALMTTWIASHGLEGRAAVELERQIDAFLVEGEDLLDPETGALWGSVVSGALGGLAADVLAGGLTFGGGVVAGAILGAFGGAGLARGFQLAKGERQPTVAWAPAFLEQLTAQALLRYLAVAHFGRGQGEFQDLEASGHWQGAVAAVLRRSAADFAAAWKLGSKAAEATAVAAVLEPLVAAAMRRLLIEFYPQSASLLSGASAAVGRD